MPLNESALLASPILGPIAKLIAGIQVIVGGLFGVYLILLILRWKEYHRMAKLLKQIKKEVEEINQKLKSPKKKR